MTSTATHRTTLVANVALAAASLAVVFGAAEAALAWRDSRWRARFDDSSENRVLCTSPADDPRLLYTMRPNACSANSRGYLDIEHSIKKPAGVFRIVVIGDSIAAGQGVAREERFASRIGAQLADRGVEMVVLARAGYSTSQELVVLESEAFAYEPDLIIWAYCLNDPASPIHHDANGELGRYFFRPRSHALHQLSRLYFKARENWVRSGCGDDYHAMLHCVYRDDVAAHIGAIGSLARSHQTTVLFAIVPLFDRDSPVLEGVHQQLGSLASAAGLVPVDLRHIIRDVPPGTFALPGPTGLDPWHPNAIGHALMAEDLTREALRVLEAEPRHPSGQPEAPQPLAASER